MLIERGRLAKDISNHSFIHISFFFFLGPYGQPPANHVIIRERYRNNDGDLALGMLAGAATGMALGSLFWVF